MMKQKMWTRSFSKVISLIVLYNQTVAAFDVALDVIGSVDNSPTLACGNNVIFMCSSTPVTDEMDWFIDNTNIATCKFGLCAPQVTIPTNVLFEYDVTKGIYNLTFTPILESNGAREYKCDFGLDFKSLTPTVTVFPDNSNSGITNSTSSNDINITASTCVSSSDLVSFKWYIFKAGESRKLFGTVPTNRMNESSCQSTTNCNGEMSTSTVTIKNLGEENGEYYYFQVEIIYDYSSDAEPNKVTINSPTHYRISENSPETDDNGCEIDIKEIIFIVLTSFSRIYAIQIVLFFTIFASVIENIGTGQGCTVWMVAFISNLPILGFILLLITILCVFFKKVCQCDYDNSNKNRFHKKQVADCSQHNQDAEGSRAQEIVDDTNQKRITIEWSWIMTITVAVILIFGPGVICIMICLAMLSDKDYSNIWVLVPCFFIFGCACLPFELYIFVYICQDYREVVILAPLIIHAILLAVLVTAHTCIVFLTKCQCDNDNSNKYCCHKKQVADWSQGKQDAEGSRAQGKEEDTNQNPILSMSSLRLCIMGHHSTSIQHKDDVLRQQQSAGKGKLYCGKCKEKENNTAPCAYCLTHKLYICTNCLNECRRIRCVVLWNKDATENLFNCSLCSDMFPVVCYDVVSRVFKCVNCSQLSTHTPGREHKLPRKVSNKIAEITHDPDKFQRHKEVSADGESSCSQDVFCLVCEMIMCRKCFYKHKHDKLTSTLRANVTLPIP